MNEKQIYFINKKIDKEYISKTINFSASKIISGEDCLEICQKINFNKKSLLLFGDSHAGDFENILTIKLQEKKIDLYLSTLSSKCSGAIMFIILEIFLSEFAKINKPFFFKLPNAIFLRGKLCNCISNSF